MNKDRTILHCIKNNSVSNPNKLAIASTKQELNYQQYWNKICAAASFLKSKGIKKNEHIIVKAAQNIDFLIVCHAVQLSGGICVPVERSLNGARLSELLNIIGCKKCFSDIMVDGIKTFDLKDAVNYKNCMQNWKMPKEKDVSMVLFTTGTTGKSKGIVLNYLSEYAVAQNVLFGVNMKADNIELIPMPMNHSFSLRRYFANMLNCSSVIITDGVVFAKIFFELVEKYKATSMAMAPAAMNILLQLSKDKIANYNFQLDYIQFGTAPISQAEKDKLIELLPDVRLYNIYGSTEYGCACCLNFNSNDNKSYCIGYPTKNSKLKIVDENFNEITDHSHERPGYLSWSGSMGMNGFFKDEELTKKNVVNGYLKTNDLGYIDNHGLVYMLGRADDVIISGGNKISPTEVEEVARKFPGIIDCICKKENDIFLEYIPVLYIVADSSLNLNKLNEHLAEFLEDFKRPKHIKFTSSIPRTYNNKIDRNKNL